MHVLNLMCILLCMFTLAVCPVMSFTGILSVNFACIITTLPYTLQLHTLIFLDHSMMELSHTTISLT